MVIALVTHTDLAMITTIDMTERTPVPGTQILGTGMAYTPGTQGKEIPHITKT